MTEESAYPISVLVKLVLAVICGGIVGWQREAHDRPAGLRTHVLVCLGAAVYTLASMSFSGPNADPGRVAAQVATGMGFLGAGTIIRHGNVVRGLTTAASLWAVAAIGLCVAIGGQVWWVAAISTVIVLLTLTVLRREALRLQNPHGRPDLAAGRRGAGDRQASRYPQAARPRCRLARGLACGTGWGRGDAGAADAARDL
jgi:uncharacterized membrane protein YhiD involved in acid resistance